MNNWKSEQAYLIKRITCPKTLAKMWNELINLTIDRASLLKSDIVSNENCPFDILKEAVKMCSFSNDTSSRLILSRIIFNKKCHKFSSVYFMEVFI